MVLLGDHLIVAWLDVPLASQADVLEWHSREHLPERLAVPGFRRGRRFAATASSSRFFILYEVSGADVLCSPAYLERLNNPTPWTLRSMRHFQNSTRAAMRVDCSMGGGSASHMLTVRFDGPPSANLRARLIDELAPQWASRPGVTAVHVATHEIEASNIDTTERRHSGTVSDQAGLVLLIEAYRSSVLMGIETDDLSARRLHALGACGSVHRERVQLQHCLHADDSGTT
jgi:hypothetical protein